MSECECARVQPTLAVQPGSGVAWRGQGGGLSCTSSWAVDSRLRLRGHSQAVPEWVSREAWGPDRVTESHVSDISKQHEA